MSGQGSRTQSPPSSGSPEQVGGSVVGSGTEASPSPSPAPAQDAGTLAITPVAITLFVPPPDGSAPLFPAAASLEVSGAPGAVYWQSSDPGVARVSAGGSAGGLVQAGRAGFAVISVASGTQTATASVTVAEKARLVVGAVQMPAGAATLSARVLDAQEALSCSTAAIPPISPGWGT